MQAYQVIRYFFNIFTGTPQQQVSNFHHAEPDSDWVEAPESPQPLQVTHNHNFIERSYEKYSNLHR